MEEAPLKPKKKRNVRRAPAVCLLHEENLTLQLRAIQASVNANYELQELVNKHQNEELSKILKQTTETNGKVARGEEEMRKVKESMKVWTWLTDKPARLVFAICGVVLISRLVTNEFVWQLIGKLF